MQHFVVLPLFAIVLAAAPAAADVLELHDGRRLEGHLLAAGPTRLLFEQSGQGSTLFLDRIEVKRISTDTPVAGDHSPAELEGIAEQDPAGLVTFVDGPVRILRRDRELQVLARGPQAALRDGDQLRTGPYGRITFLTPEDAVCVARSDAIVSFHAGAPLLEEGALHVQSSVQASILLRSGRLVVVDGKAQAEHLRGRTRITCLAGRASFLSRDGYRLELPRNHVVELESEQGQQPASVTTAVTNAWAIRLEYGARRVSLQPGERVLLLGLPSAGAPQPAATPPPVITAGASPSSGAPAPPRSGDAGERAARLVHATAAFALERWGSEQVERITPSEATGVELHSGDVIVASQGEVVLASGSARLRLLPTARAVIQPIEGGPPFRLLEGEAVFETPARERLAHPAGELTLLNGSASLRTERGNTHLNLSRGTAEAHCGDGALVELLAPAQLSASTPPGRARLEVPAAARQSAHVTLGGLKAELRPGRQVNFSRTGALDVIEGVVPGVRLELLGGVAAQVVAGPDETDALELADRRSVPLKPGTYRFAREGDRVVANQLPDGVTLEGLALAATQPIAPSAPTGAPAAAVEPPRAPSPTPALAEAGTERHTLSNGAQVVTRGWGPLDIKRLAGEHVVVAGPGSSEVFLGPNTSSILAKTSGQARFETADGRYVVHEAGAPGFTARLDAGGQLTVEVLTPGQAIRRLEVDAGTDFDLAIRRDQYVLSYVFGQVVYVEPGQEMIVTREHGLKLVAADRSGR